MLHQFQAVSVRWQLLHENSQPTYSQKISKQISSSQILRILALERAWSATTQLVKSVIVGYDQRTLENAAEEVQSIPSFWLKIIYENILHLIEAFF